MIGVKQPDRRAVAAALVAAFTAPVTAVDAGAGRSPPIDVADWLHAPTAAAFQVPLDYLGLHSDHGMGGATLAPTFEYDAVRSHDAHDAKLYPMTQWAAIETAPGVFNWSSVDRWIAAHPGRTRIWVLFGTPRFHQKYAGEKFPYPYLTGGGSPPRDPEAAASFIGALLRRYPGQIKHVELWNEPNFGWAGSDPQRDRWQMPKPGFFTGTASDLAGMARAVKRVLPSDVALMAGAWEGQDSNPSLINSLLRFSAAPDGGGGIGRDHVGALSVHAYTYKNDPNALISVLRNYDARFRQAGYGADLARYVTEIGAEAPGFWTAEAPSLAEKVKTIKRWIMIPASLGYSGVYLYKHSLMRTLGDPQRNPALARAIQQMRNGLRGKVLRAAARLRDETIWMSFSDGTTLRA